MQDGGQTHVAVHVSPPPVQEDARGNRQEDREEELPMGEVSCSLELNLK